MEGAGAAPTGAETIGGIVFSCCSTPDMGLFLSGGATAGFNVSADVFIGYVRGDISAVSGETINNNFGFPWFSVTTFHAPDTMDLIGLTLGIGPAATPAAYSAAIDYTVTATVGDLFKFFDPSSVDGNEVFEESGQNSGVASGSQSSVRSSENAGQNSWIENPFQKPVEGGTVQLGSLIIRIIFRGDKFIC